MAKKYGLDQLTPKKIVKELDKYVIGQNEAKKMVAIAVRNRYRRMKLPPDMRDEIAPKNIMLIGPTGVGKTEIARRLAKLISAPFVKVEATKFTEIGYVGRNVDSMVRDLVEVAVNMIRVEEIEKIKPEAEKAAEEKLLDKLLPPPRRIPKTQEEHVRVTYRQSREKMRHRLRKGELDSREVEIEVEEKPLPFMQVISPGGIEEFGLDMGGMLDGLFPSRKRRRVVKVSDAKKILLLQESEKLIDNDKIVREGMRRASELGIIYVDEIDKVVSGGKGYGPDVSREGVQRDLLPIVEGTTVITRYGPVKTDHILFISAGSFSNSKPSDLIPELQGRFPLRAELSSLTAEDFVKILTEPENAIIKQYTYLLSTEKVKIEFTKDAIEEMAMISAEVNATTQDIGARRLHTVVEKVLDDISFEASEIGPKTIVIDKNFVKERLKNIIESEDLKRYIL
jgi:ATP-dependent HslUV protease ATP-binding subunit HslU